jgi:hypothetical protein
MPKEPAPSRRSILQFLPQAAFSASALSAVQLHAQQNQATDDEMADFWINQIRKPAAGQQMGQEESPYERDPVYFYWDSKGGMRSARKMTEEGLPASGDIDLDITLSGYRLSRADQVRFGSLKTGKFRFSIAQQNTFPDLSDVLIWSLAAALIPNTTGGKSASDQLHQFAQSVQAEWGNSKTIPLPGGAGTAALNFFLKKNDTFFGRLLSTVLKANQTIAPFLCMPAIAKPALDTVSIFLGEALKDGAPDSRHWVFQAKDTPFCCTVEALKKTTGDSVIRMRTGQYVVIPRSHVDSFNDEHPRLRVDGGYLVPKSAPEEFSGKVITDTAPDVSYVTLSVVANPKKSSAGCAASNSAAPSPAKPADSKATTPPATKKKL